MKQTSEIEIEDIITARLRRDDPGIERIGAHHDGAGWRCHRVWLTKDAPRLYAEETKTIPAKANLILADLLKQHEIVRTRKLPPGKPLTVPMSR